MNDDDDDDNDELYKELSTKDDDDDDEFDDDEEEEDICLCDKLSPSADTGQCSSRHNPTNARNKVRRCCRCGQF